MLLLFWGIFWVILLYFDVVGLNFVWYIVDNFYLFDF